LAKRNFVQLPTLLKVRQQNLGSHFLGDLEKQFQKVVDLLVFVLDVVVSNLVDDFVPVCDENSNFAIPNLQYISALNLHSTYQPRRFDEQQLYSLPVNLLHQPSFQALHGFRTLRRKSRQVMKRHDVPLFVLNHQFDASAVFQFISKMPFDPQNEHQVGQITNRRALNLIEVLGQLVENYVKRYQLTPISLQHHTFLLVDLLLNDSISSYSKAIPLFEIY
jgi:hypothetical protein